MCTQAKVEALENENAALDANLSRTRSLLAALQRGLAEVQLEYGEAGLVLTEMLEEGIRGL